MLLGVKLIEILEVLLIQELLLLGVGFFFVHFFAVLLLMTGVIATGITVANLG